MEKPDDALEDLARASIRLWAIGLDIPTNSSNIFFDLGFRFS